MAFRRHKRQPHAREFARLCLDVVRRADRPLSSCEIARAVLRRLGLPVVEGHALLAVAHRVDRYLSSKAPALVQRRLYGPLALGWATTERASNP